VPLLVLSISTETSVGTFGTPGKGAVDLRRARNAGIVLRAQSDERLAMGGASP
jgi:hypothetical protein